MDSNIPKKGISKKTLIGIIAGAVALIVAVIIILVIVKPSSSQRDIKGKYVCDEVIFSTIIFDNGTYERINTSGEVIEVGTYKIKGDKVTLTPLSGPEHNIVCTIKSDDCILWNYPNTDDYEEFDLVDTNATIAIELAPDYVAKLEEELSGCYKEVINGIEEANITASSLYLSKDAAEKQNYTAVIIMDILDYENNPTLKYLIENNLITIDIYIKDGSLDVKVNTL